MKQAFKLRTDSKWRALYSIVNMYMKAYSYEHRDTGVLYKESLFLGDNDHNNYREYICRV